MAAAATAAAVVQGRPSATSRSNCRCTRLRNVQCKLPATQLARARAPLLIALHLQRRQPWSMRNRRQPSSSYHPHINMTIIIINITIIIASYHPHSITSSSSYSYCHRHTHPHIIIVILIPAPITGFALDFRHPCACTHKLWAARSPRR